MSEHAASTPPAATPPRPRHPAALAFQSSSASALSSSSKISRKINELGWRQVHSHSEHYPFSSSSAGINLRVRQKQCGEQDGTGTGAVVWNAAHVLSTYLCGNPASVIGKRIMDLGTGTGLTGLVALHLGASDVTLTDIGPVLDLTRENVASNVSDSLSAKASVSEYWWGSGALGKHCFDVVLVADCILPKLYPIAPLVDAIDELLVEGEGGVCFVSYEHRTWHEFDPREEVRICNETVPYSEQYPNLSLRSSSSSQFRALCEDKNLSTTSIPSHQLGSVAEDITIWRVVRTPPQNI